VVAVAFAPIAVATQYCDAAPTVPSKQASLRRRPMDLRGVELAGAGLQLKPDMPASFPARYNTADPKVPK